MFYRQAALWIVLSSVLSAVAAPVIDPIPAASIPAQIHNEPGASVERRYATVNILCHIDPYGAREHCDFKQPDVVCQALGVHRFGCSDRVLL